MTATLAPFLEEETDTSIDFSSDDHSIDFCDNRKHYEEIRKILLPVKQKVLNKIVENLSLDKKELNYAKAAVPEINVYNTFERTLTTCVGLKLQEIAAVCGKNVTNIDKAEGKVLGVDLRLVEDPHIYEGQMKANTNTQTGTHKPDSVKKLLETTDKNGTIPFFATAFGESYEYTGKDGILYIGGESFWKKIGVDYDTVYNTTIEIIREIHEEFKLLDISIV